jgi:hypothetical protein
MTSTHRQAARRRRREGAVLLIVLLILMMATGSALFAMQATFYEQRSSTSYAEAAWTRSIAEGAAMAGMAVVEEMGPGNQPGLDARWSDGAGRAPFSTKYALATPMAGTTAPVSNADVAQAFDCALFSGAYAGNPVGLIGYIAPTRDGQSPYGAYQAQYRVPTARVLFEQLVVGTRTRTVITGIGETALPVNPATGLPADPMDMDGQRGLHETVGMTRAYVDIDTPVTPWTGP